MLAFFSISNFKSQLTGIFDLGLSLKKMSAQTGISVGTLVSLQGSLKTAGIDAAALGLHVNKMQKFLTKKGSGKEIAALGLDFKAVMASSPDEQFIKIGQAIGDVKNPAERATAALKIFGKGGGVLLPLFVDQDFGAGKLSNAAKVLDKNADTFAKVSVLLGQTGKPIKGFFIGVAAAIAGSFIPLLKAFNSIDLVKIGLIFGAGMIAAANAFKGAFSDPGTALSAITDGLIAGFLTAGNFLIGIFEFLAKLVSDKGFWDGLLNVFIGLEFIISGALMKGFNTPLAFFRDTMEFVVTKAVAAFDNLNPLSTTKKDIKKLETDIAGYQEKLTGRASFQMMTGGMGGQVTIPGTLPEADPKKRKALQNSIAAAQAGLAVLTESKTFSSIQAANKGEQLTVGGLTPDQLIAQGQTIAGKGGSNIMANAVEKFKAAKVTDLLGAGTYATKAAAGFNILRAQGAEMMGPAVPGAAAAKIAAVQRTSAFNFGQSVLAGKGEQGIGSRGGLVSRGLQAMSSTSLKPLAVKTPPTPADKAAIDNAKNSGDLLAEFKNLVAAWTH